jgi:hypothetical protein
MQEGGLMRRIPALVGAIVLVAGSVTTTVAAPPTSSPAPSSGNSTSAAIHGPDRGAMPNVKPGGKPGPSPSPTPTPAPGTSVQLTPWWSSGRPVWEPQGSGTDDAGLSYSDSNYWNFCGPGATAVALGFWPSGYKFVTSIAPQSYTEPNLSLSIQATTTWAATDTVSSGRGAIMDLAENILPTPDVGAWTWPGVIDWSQAYPYDGTPVNRIRDALNWVISSQTSVTGPYIWTAYAQAGTASAIVSGIEADLNGQNTAAAGQPMPVVANVRTASGRYHLANWSNKLGVNHSVTIIGYDNGQGTFTYADTCGPGCNNTGDAAGVYTVSQATMVALLAAETDGDGLIW